MRSIAADGLMHLVRIRWVFITGAILSLAIGAWATWRVDVSPGTRLGPVAALVVFVAAGWGTCAGSVMSRAAICRHRRPERLRSARVDDASVLLGTMVPAIAVAALQMVLMLVVLGAVAGPPGAPGTFVAATCLVLSLMSTLGLATVAVTRSARHARGAALLMVTGVIAVAVWVAVAGTGELARLKRLLPGGGAAELVIAAWDGAVVAADVPLMVGPTLGWVMTAAFLGSTYSTWGHLDHKQSH